MGYYIQLTDSDWLLPVQHYEEAFRRLKALNHKPGIEKRGGSWESGGKTEEWFSWMPADYDKTVKTVREIFELLGFSCSETEEGLRLTGYDNKTGQEELFLAEISDLVSPKSFLIWRGEEGHTWTSNYGLA